MLEYPTLPVPGRIARLRQALFATPLSAKVQDEIIMRTEHTI